MDHAAVALACSVGSAWARLGSLLQLLSGRGAEAVRVLAMSMSCGVVDGDGPRGAVDCAKAHSQLGAADLPALGPAGSPAGPRRRRPRLTPRLTPRRDAAP